MNEKTISLNFTKEDSMWLGSVFAVALLAVGAVAFFDNKPVLNPAEDLSLTSGPSN